MMSQEVKRFHPAWIVVEFFALMKNSIAIFLFLFVLKINSTSNWIVWGRYIFLIGIAWTLILIVLKWLLYRYEKIQNHHSKTTLIHKWFGLTSLTLETGTTVEGSAVNFPVLTVSEKERILSRLLDKAPSEDEGDQDELEHGGEKKVHFRSNKKDLLKASFTSLSFLAIFPLLTTIYFNLADFFNIEDTAEGAFDYLLLHWWMLILLFLLAMVLSVGIGYLQTTIKYGKSAMTLSVSI